ncbi:FAD-dependent oxidoreductase [Saccharopolyspora sp. CA-218241]|uniref:FAD-dependent oxidoreductase n=1 Tax=Saccharopolyspora sp. CA-218241 TaxID=3240027 RepID=UPI003D960120
MSPRPVPVQEVGEPDHETDVLVVGFGCAGAAAAHEARARGARVLVLERAGAPGGSSALSGGELYLGGGTPVQRACGFTDTAEDMFAYLEAALGPHVDAAKLRLYCAGSAAHFDWLRELGVEFQHSLHEAPTWMPLTTDGLMWLGENAWPYAELARPAPRGHRPPAPGPGGRVLMDALIAAVSGAGAVVHVDTRARALIRDGDRVVGVVARRYGRDLVYRARRGVVLTTGGFVDNERMLADHAPDLLAHGKVSDGLDDGDGILMAMAAGAATRRMAAAQIALTALPALAVRGMLVNARGRRFINEDVYPGLFSIAAVRHQPGPCWVIADEAAYEDVPEPERWGVRPVHVAATAAELERDLGMPDGALRGEVREYNRHAARGADPVLRKSGRWLRPLRAPLAAFDPRLGFAGGARRSAGIGTGAAAFTLGGLRTTPDGAVLDVPGEPVPGLFAAGRASSGLHGDGYVSGTSLGDGTFFGRRAGAAAAGSPARDAR